MIAVIQRVNEASVVADGVLTGEIQKGLLILLGVAEGDTENDCLLLADKISKLRIFSDENDKLNLSLADVNGETLIASNFTLLANYVHGNRPDYLQSAKPDVARLLYEHFLSLMEARVTKVGHGIFGADMKIRMEADGPITIVMDSLKLRKGRPQ